MVCVLESQGSSEGVCVEGAHQDPLTPNLNTPTLWRVMTRQPDCARPTPKLGGIPQQLGDTLIITGATIRWLKASYREASLSQGI